MMTGPPTARRGAAARLVLVLMPMFLAVSGFTFTPTAGGIQFAADANIPPAVQAFAWRVIATRCDFQRHELEQRSFWAYDARTRNVEGVVVYSIGIVSDLTWKRTEPPAMLQIVLAEEGGRLRLTGLTSSFIRCHP